MRSRERDPPALRARLCAFAARHASLCVFIPESTRVPGRCPTYRPSPRATFFRAHGGGPDGAGRCQ
eukprot:3354577-Prymnesium_polylepis.1